MHGFAVERYLGQWYEIARLDHRFERGLEQVTATYALNARRYRISVLNKGYRPDEAAVVAGRWQGPVRRGAKDVAALEVSFFGPFYGAYNVIDLDPEYQHAPRGRSEPLVPLDPVALAGASRRVWWSGSSPRRSRSASRPRT